jgi:hypothetical protein
MREAGATTVVVVGGPSADAGEWRHGVGPGTVILADSDGRWKAEIARHLDLPADGAMLLLLDRYLAPRVVSHGHEAGALVDPVEATDWLRFVELDCPECSGEIDWPEDALTV